MIFDTIENLSRYKAIPNLDRILDFIKNKKLLDLPEGRIDIDGNKLFANVARYFPKPAEENDFETHGDYTDVHLIVKGVEKIQTFTASDNISDIIVKENHFVVFFPGEPHKPGCYYQDLTEPVIKIVFKTAFDLNYREFFGARKETILKLAELYPKEQYDNEKKKKQRGIMYGQEFNRLRRYFNLEKGGRVLDIGCGQGDFLALFGKNWQKYGIEISEFGREQARKKNILIDFELKDNFFDLIIFRGTIQHIPDPIYRIGQCYYWLKSGGGLAFLATPNTNCLYYKLFNTLPMLVANQNFFLPSDITLKQILLNFGFKVEGTEYPYLGTPYASPLKDIFNFLLKLLKIRKNIKVPFYKNMMECYAKK